MKSSGATSLDDYERIARAIEFIQQNREHQPSLDTIAHHVGLSEFHLQRLFLHWAGISPKRLLQFLTLEHAKLLLLDSMPILEASFATGLSGPGRLHDLFVTLEALTPGEFRSQGTDMKIRYGFFPSMFGRALIATTERGICGLAFCETTRDNEVLRETMRRWPQANWIRDDDSITRTARAAFSGMNRRAPLSLLVHGTNFQIQIWRALLQIASGTATTYAEVAKRAGCPEAIRATAGAIGDNPIAWLIPCHRVLRKNGALGGYHWGLTRKSAMLAWEAAKSENHPLHHDERSGIAKRSR